jgi:hypothetical protein
VTATPPNLRALFGDRYRIGYDPAAETAAERNDPWMMTLPCQNGVIYPHGANRLAVECKTQPAHKLMAIPAITVQQQGDAQWTLIFDLEMADLVFGIVKPRKRRKLSEVQKAANAELSQGPSVPKWHAAQAPKIDEGRARSAKGGLRSAQDEFGAWKSDGLRCLDRGGHSGADQHGAHRNAQYRQ